MGFDFWFARTFLQGRHQQVADGRRGASGCSNQCDRTKCRRLRGNMMSDGALEVPPEDAPVYARPISRRSVNLAEKR